MKKGIFSGLGVLFVVAILISGCGKSEEKKAEAPLVKKQTVQQKATPVQEKAAAVKQEVLEKAEPAVETATEKAATMTDQAVGAAKWIWGQALNRDGFINVFGHIHKKWQDLSELNTKGRLEFGPCQGLSPFPRPEAKS